MNRSSSTNNGNFILNHLSYYLSGLIDSFRYDRALLFLYTSNIVRVRFIQCFILNGIIFLGSIVLYDFILTPIIHIILSMNSPYNSNLSNPNTQISTLFELIYSIFWLWPIYCISFILSSIWYQDIANQTFIVSGRVQNQRPITFKSWIQQMSEEVYRLLLVTIYSFQVLIISYIPYNIGFISSVFCMSWLYALYSFEYKWALSGWNYDSKIDYFERRASYFAGFGTIPALVTLYFPRFIGSGIFALIFPIFIILAVNTIPQPVINSTVSTSSPSSGSIISDPNINIPYRLPIFKSSEILNNWILRLIQKKRKH